MERYKKILSKEFLYRKRINFLKKYLPNFYNRFFPYEDARLYYLNRTGKMLSYSHPHNINEKLMWLSRYWKNPLKVTCADKYLVREYVKECGCENILIPLYGVFKSANDINFDALPNSFVLKCNHGCGYNILCKNKNEFDIEKAKIFLNTWMAETYGLESYEYHYAEIKPLIIAEEFLNPSSNEPITDYKIHCINGEPLFILICSDRDVEKHQVNLISYSLDWERLDYLKSEGKNIPKPVRLKEMIEYASKLSKPFPYVRVDLYYIENQIYFGELTFTPAANIMDYYKDSALDLMGKRLILPKKI
ncbi:MAG: glycosyl transferase [Bacillus cereus]|jgi:hypothetical protein|nr:glycosyl transferase [Bacillus cereus]